MGNIVDYLKEYGDCPISQMPFNDVDSLVLCQLSYLKFDGIVPEVKENRASVTVEEIAKHADYEKLYADVRFEKENRALFEALLAGERYRHLKLNCYVSLTEKEWETQFAAVTYILENGSIYVAFRGTDETIVGWKEDFNMAFLSPVPGQAYSVKYLNIVAGRLHNPILIGGHSKGGNLAVYSAMNCIPSVRERICKVYSMDGPGFRPEVLADGCYERIADRVAKILPQSSLVGMIFERDIRYEVVESTTFGLAQHDPYTWKVEGRHFKKVSDIYESRKFMDDTINQWILSLDEERLKAFVDTLYQVISASEADDLIAFGADWKKSMNNMMAALKEVDEETSQMLKEVIRSLFEIARLRVRGEMADRFNSGRQKSRRKEEKVSGRRTD